MDILDQKLSRKQASDAVGAQGWRLLLGALCASVPVRSLAQAVEVAASAVSACGDDADGHLHVDIRPGRVVLTLQSLAQAAVTGRDADLAERLSAVVRAAGLRTEPELATETGAAAGTETGAETGTRAVRSVQMLEIAIDALDIPAIRPFWQAVMGYTDEAEPTCSGAGLVDPVGQGPAIWFQQMDQPRPQRNRIHFDLCVPHDEAQHRIEAALAAGGRLVSADEAPALWVLADSEGNEICVTTWQGRDATP
ncbi:MULTISPECIES: VOC family protein [Streptacidiphilus]|uniref:VOC family protein n=1 Tax=Streptacidiphilus cavernicola TaxID=3342716 RepID=A0ABV6UHX0_9ACTN|nr:VOC family protein [Streptacidiphilus jeojiense]